LAGDRTKIIALHSKHFARRQNGQSADDKKKKLLVAPHLRESFFSRPHFKSFKLLSDWSVQNLKHFCPQAKWTIGGGGA